MKSVFFGVFVALSLLVVPSLALAQAATDLTCVRCVSAIEIATNAINSNHIVNGTIVDVDISSSAAIAASKILDGVGSGLDADFFDGLDSWQFLRSDQSGILNGDLSINGQVGIGSRLSVGTTSPTNTLDVVSTGNTKVLIHANDVTNDRNPELELRAGNTDAGGHSIIKFGKTGGTVSERLEFQNEAGVNILTLIGSGNVGIGKVDPSSNLDVNGVGVFGSTTVSIGGSSGLSGERISLSYNGYEAIAHLTGSPGVSLGLGTDGINNRVLINGVGNVGIGTSTPNYPLDVNGIAQAHAWEARSTGTPYLDFSNDTTSDYDARFILYGDDVLSLTGTTDFSMDGHVGIGTNNSPAELHVNDPAAGGELRVTGFNGIYGIYMGADESHPYFGTYTNNDLRLITNGSEKARLTAGGYLGLGTTNPSTLLHLYSGIATPLQIQRTSSHNANIQYSNTAGSMYAGVNPTANFGIGSSDDLTNAPFIVEANGEVNIAEEVVFADGSSAALAFPDPNLSNQSDTGTPGTIAYYLNQMSGSGGTVYLRAGTYTLEGPLDVASNISILGTGTNSIIKVKDGVDKRMIRNPGAVDGSSGTAVSNVTLGHFSIEGDAGNGEDCIVFDATDADPNENIELYGLTVKNCGGNGILIVDSKKVRLSDVYFNGNGTTSVEKSYPDHNIYLRNVYYVTLSHILSTGSSSDGIHVADGENVSIGDVVSWNNGGRGIFLGGVYYGTVSNAVVYDNDDDGIEVVGDASDSEKTNSRNIAISGCSAVDNDQNNKRGLSTPAGIYVRDTTALTLNGCVVRDNEYGVVLAAGTIDAAFTGNTSKGNSKYGLHIGSGAEDILIDGNNLQDNTSGAILNSSSDPEIKTGDNLT